MNRVQTGARARQGSASAAAANGNNDLAELMKSLGQEALVGGSLALSAIAGFRGYGASSPLYALVKALGVPSAIVNTVDDAFTSHADLAAALEEGQAGVSYSEKYDAFSLGVKDNGAIFYFSLLHDKDANPIVNNTLVLTQSVVERDFAVEIDGVKTTILKAGQSIFKAVPMEYAKKMKKAS